MTDGVRQYRYVGPKQIAERTGSPAGTPIRSAADALAWIVATGQRSNRAGRFTATFVVVPSGELLIADRHSEHVACAGGGPVLCAGEIVFLVGGGALEVAEVSNQSTGYCPEPESWPAVAVALAGAGLNTPGGFSPRCDFRRCANCEQINIVKGSEFECQACRANLPAGYNCQPDAG